MPINIQSWGKWELPKILIPDVLGRTGRSFSSPSPAKMQIKCHRFYKRYPQGSFLESFVEVNDDREMKNPFIGSSGLLIIPFGCEQKYKWWEPGGQGLEKTYQEAKINEQ